MHIACDAMDEFDKLGLTWACVSELVLECIEEVVFADMLHHTAAYHIFDKLRATQLSLTAGNLLRQP